MDNLPLLYIKNGCPWCIEAEAYLEEHEIAYEKKDVRSDPKAYAEMQEISGQRLTPTMDWDGLVLADFDTKALEAFLKKHELPPFSE